MTAPGQERVFISYATRDGADFAKALRTQLQDDGFSVWQDVVALQGSADWWSQIENTLRSKHLQHFVLVVTPGALASPVVRREIRLARQEGKTVSPVRGPGIEDMSQMPRWLGNLYDLAVPERRTNFLRVLEQQSAARRVPMMAPEPPVDYVTRPHEFDALKTKLLDSKGDAVAITAALRGAGGYGKTTLAKALAHDDDIQDAFYDGVLWVELGEQGGGRLLALIADLVALITGEARAIATVEAARTALGEALGDRRILLVIDDVWQRHHLDAFLHGGKGTTRLVTTRFDAVLPVDTERQEVDAMTAGEALTLIGWGLPADQVSAQARALGDLARHLGEWAQLLKLANGFLRDRVLKHRQPLDRALPDLFKRFAARGLDALSATGTVDYADRHRSVAKVIQTSLELLDADKRARFGELGIFPEDADIPVGILARLWAETGGLDDIATEDLLAELYGLSLLLNLDLDRRTFRFHDTTRHFLQHQAGKDGLVAQHKRLIQAMGDIGGAKATPAAELDYFYRYLPQHLADAGERDTLDALLMDPGWLAAKLAATASPQTLVTDFEQHGRGDMQDFIGRTLRLTAGILARDPRQLMPQLLGRLARCAAPEAPAFLAQARRHLQTPAILTQRPSLAPPGAELMRLEANAGAVNDIVLLPSGDLASAHEDGSIRAWNLKTGVQVRELRDVPERVAALALLKDGVVASGHFDGRINLWDLERGKHIRGWAAHADAVNGLCALRDGRLVSASSDSTIAIWDAATAYEQARLIGHAGWVRSILQLADGRLASASYHDDHSLRFWNLETGNADAMIEKIGTSGAESLIELRNGRLVAGCFSEIIKIDPATASIMHTSDRHRSSVTALAELSDDRLATGGGHGDPSIELGVPGQSTNARLIGHTASINRLLVLEQDRLASASDDGTIRVWDINRASLEEVDTELPASSGLYLYNHTTLFHASDNGVLTKHDVATGGVSRFRLSGGRIGCIDRLSNSEWIVESFGRTISTWTIDGSEPSPARPLGWKYDKYYVCVSTICAVSPSSFAEAVYSFNPADPSIRICDLKSGAVQMELVGHTDTVWRTILLSNGRLASSSSDKTVRQWDLATGRQCGLMEFDCWISAFVELPDGRLAAGGEQRIYILDLQSGQRLGELEGHTAVVQAIIPLRDGRLASGAADNTVRIWDLAAARELACIEVDAPVTHLAELPDGRIAAADKIGRLHWLEFLA